MQTFFRVNIRLKISSLGFYISVRKYRPTVKVGLYVSQYIPEAVRGCSKCVGLLVYTRSMFPDINLQGSVSNMTVNITIIHGIIVPLFHNTLIQENTRDIACTILTEAKPAVSDWLIQTLRGA